MKKMKLFAPLLGSVITLGSVVPAVACTYKEKDAKYFKVNIDKQFTLSNKKEIKEWDAFETEITWKKEGFIVNEAKVRIEVGNQLLSRDDYTYVKKTDQKGYLKINEGVVCGDVTIKLELMEANKAPVTLLNIGDSTKGVTVRANRDDATINDDLTLKLSWTNTEEKTYYANFITIFIGTTRLEKWSTSNQNGYYLSDLKVDGVTLHVPKKNIVDNREISILVDLEESTNKQLWNISTYEEKYLIYQSKSYDVLRSQGSIYTRDPDYMQYKSVVAGEAIEFVIDLNEWLNVDTAADSDILFVAGYWYYDDFFDYEWKMPFETLDVGRLGAFYINGNPNPLSVELDSDNNALAIHCPAGMTWRDFENEDESIIITSWYVFEDGHPYPQILVGLPHQN